MEFPKSYFEDEVRDGFYVPAMIKKAWAAQLQVLEDVDRVCRENNIQYFAEWGTLLGAVRHHGFIPWDDDMDICMKRADYNKFLAIAKDKLPKGYDLFGIHNEENLDNIVTRVINTRTINFSQEFLYKFNGFPFCSGIDIFPLDFIAPNPDDDKFVKDVINIVNSVAKAVGSDAGAVTELESELCEIEEMCGVQLKRDDTLFQQLNILVDNLCSIYTEEEAKDITIMALWLEGGTYKFPKEYYSKSVRIPFENTTIPVPVAYDSILKRKYGDYMKPVHTWDSHEYPFFDRQINVLKRNAGAKFIEFHMTYDEIKQEEERKKEIRQSRKPNREVVFLPYKAETWNAMDSLWRAAVDDKQTDVYVIPTPYYYKNGDGTTDGHFDIDKFPKDVKLTSFNDYDISKRCPDVIVIQNPYDEYNYTTTVHPMFYSSNLASYTNKLVYVPYFMTDEIDERDERALKNMDSYCLMPGVVYSDEVIVQSEEMAKLYVNKLCQMVGEESREYWTGKIKGTGSPLQDMEIKGKVDNIPVQWENILLNNGVSKKTILMSTSANGLLEYKHHMITKLERVLDTFAGYKDDIVLLWYWESEIEQVVCEINPDIWNEFIDMLSRITMDNFIPIGDENVADAIALCDGYYGDAGLVAQKCRNAGKPVMLLNVEC